MGLVSKQGFGVDLKRSADSQDILQTLPNITGGRSAASSCVLHCVPCMSSGPDSGWLGIPSWSDEILRYGGPMGGWAGNEETASIADLLSGTLPLAEPDVTRVVNDSQTVR